MIDEIELMGALHKNPTNKEEEETKMEDDGL